MQITAAQPCFHQQTCVTVEAGEVALIVIATPIPTALDNLTAVSYHDQSLIELDRLSSNMTLLRYTSSSIGIHVIRLTLHHVSMDIGVMVEPWNCLPSIDPGCTCPAGTFAHADGCATFGKVAKIVVVPCILLLISLALMLAQSKAMANQAWSIKPSELKFSNPPEILGAGRIREPT